MVKRLKLLSLKNGSSLLDYFKQFLHSYFANTGLHGCKYMVEERYSTFGALCWAIWLLISFVFCLCLILLQLNRFQETAILNSIASTGYPVWKQPFPAVIICNNNIVYKQKTENITSILRTKGVNEEDIEQFFVHLSHMVLCVDCDEDDILTFNITSASKIFSYLVDLNYDMDELMAELAHPCSKMLKKCFWKSDEKNCTQFFRMARTTLGYCCTFNYFATKQFQVENYERSVYYSGGFGFGSGMQVVIDVEPSEYVSSVKKTPGIEVLVGNIHQYAEMGLRSHSIRMGQVLTVGLYPTIYESQSNVKFVNDKRRQCWFQNEGKPEWTKTYNSLTCFNECKAKFIHSICNCVPFYYAMSEKDEEICSIKDLTCLVHNDSTFAHLMLSTDVDADKQYWKQLGRPCNESKFCYCLPNCDEVTYEIQKNAKLTHLSDNTCILNIHFNSISGTLVVRTVHVTWDTLLATIGGIFGLCMGGSILTILEIVFFAVDTFFRRRKDHKNKIYVQPQTTGISVLSYRRSTYQRNYIN